MTLSTTQAISSSAATNTIGVNTHLDFSNYGYTNLTTTAAAINYLGIKNLRDSANNPNDLGANGSWQQIANATGAKFDDFMTEGSPAADIRDLSYVNQLAAQGILNFVEGGNENDNAYAIGQGNSIAWTANFQQQVYATGHALGLPVINMSFGSGWTSANNWHGDYDKVGNLSAYADYANAHTYPGVGQTTDAGIKQLNADALLAAASRPVITTEIGWNTSSVSQADAARFTLDAVLDGIKDGDVKTYFYALFDDGSGKSGLMNADGTAKPAGTALHNLTTIMADSGAARTDSLTYGLTGTTGNDHSLLMEKSNGTFQLAVWNETDSAHSVTLNLGSAAQTIRIYDPLTGSTAVNTYSNTSAVTLTVPTHPVIIEIVPSGGTTTSGSTSGTTSGTTSGSTSGTTSGSTSGSTTTATQPHPVWTVPGAETTTVGKTLAISGLSISDPWAASRGGALALNLSTTLGTISATDSTGKVLSGSGTSAIHLSGSLATLNADLAGLTFTSATAGTAKLTVDIWDQGGVEAKSAVSIAVQPTSTSGSTTTTSGSTTSGSTTSGSTTSGSTTGTTTTSSTPQTIYGGDGANLTVQGGTNSVYLLGSHGTITAIAGTNLLYTSGTGNTITGGSGTDKIQAFAGGNTLKAGSGTETINFAGSNNTIYVGSGNDTLNDSGSNNKIVFGAPGGGTAQIYGYVLKNGDTLDLRTALANTSWTKSSATIGNFLKVSQSGGDAVISVDPSGVAGGATTTLAVLHGAGSVSLSTLLAHSTTV